MKESVNRHIIFVLVACVVMGFVLMRQFFWHKEVKRVTQPDIEEDMALQVSQLYKNTRNLSKEALKLEIEYTALNAAVKDRSTARVALEKALSEYMITNGDIAVYGPGIIINFDDDMDMVQITDLANAIRNIGADAIAINNIRITPKTGWDNNTFTGPITIKIIGDKNLLKSSLERRGGIMEIIGQGRIKTEDTIEIPVAQK